MKQPDFTAFTGSTLQTAKTILTLMERCGADVRIPLQIIEEACRQKHNQVVREKRKPRPPKEYGPQPKPKQAEPVTVSTLPCPHCRRGKLRARAMRDPITGEDFSDIYCPECRASAEFKV